MVEGKTNPTQGLSCHKKQPTKVPRYRVNSRFVGTEAFSTSPTLYLSLTSARTLHGFGHPIPLPMLRKPSRFRRTTKQNETKNTQAKQTIASFHLAFRLFRTYHQEALKFFVYCSASYVTERTCGFHTSFCAKGLRRTN